MNYIAILGIILFIIIIIAMFVYDDYLKTQERNDKDDNYESPKSNDDGDNININADELKYGKILGLKGKINLNDIQKAYHRKIKEYHPDKIAMMGDELKELAKKRTQEINEAYEHFNDKYS